MTSEQTPGLDRYWSMSAATDDPRSTRKTNIQKRKLFSMNGRDYISNREDSTGSEDLSDNLFSP